MIGYFVRRNMIRSWAAVRKEDEARLAGQTLAPSVAADANLAYVDDGDPMHLLDVYYPSGATGLLPTIVDIHGGGWMHGDKDLHRHYGYSLAAHGFAVVNVSYRLLPRTDLRGQVQDLFAVLHWLERHGAEHHCDLSRMYVCGDSAGGHLAGLTACTQLNPELQAAYGVRPAGLDIKAIGIGHGMCELSDFQRVSKALGAGDRLYKEMFKMFFGRKPERAPWYGKASFTETAEGLALPPVFLVSSEVDPLHKAHAVALAEYLEKRKLPYRTKFWTKEQGERLGHVFHVSYPEWPESQETNREMLDFFLQY
jgi:acetyl esterase/lipase